jgi:DHA2 family multidrug resistance protein-like MFS transporter
VGVAGLLAAWAFVRRQRSVPDPLIDLRLFRQPGFRAALGINTLVYFVILGMLLLISQYLQLVLGLSALSAGLWMLPTMAGLVGGSLATPLFTRRLRPAIALAVGLGVATAGFGLITQASSAGLAVVVAGSAVFGLGLAPVTNLIVEMVLEAAPPESAGAASGLSETSTELGGALGIAILGSIGTAVYHYRVTALISPAIPGAAARAISGTLSGAIATAGHLPGQSAAMTLESARAAFSSGVDVAAYVSAAITAVLAVVAVIQVGTDFRSAKGARQ